ncbi:hypothetical protein [Microbacterium candidum]|uniref:Protein ImuA n=1 Tax=Microbacterium candidum TaxID=3041922 RepID=A0ABT7N420_9MICO|nr:hypothetical protein [Microbacterium sp. ASV49]MDL9981458.1 hypothetical protein [Microbacterium sp. ASV49]
MALTRPAPAEIAQLRARLARVERRQADAPVLPAPRALAGILPEPGLRRGSVYALPEAPTSLLLALLAAPSQAGSWCAVVGFPTLGIEAAEDYGIALDRLALVAEPGPRWLSVVSALAEVVPVIGVRPGSGIRPAEAARLHARLRDRGTVLLVAGAWPEAHAVLDVEGQMWSGLEDGHGLLQAREVTVTAVGRRSPVPRRARLQLPGPEGAAVGVTPAIDEAPRFPEALPVRLSAVG